MRDTGSEVRFFSLILLLTFLIGCTPPFKCIDTGYCTCKGFLCLQDVCNGDAECPPPTYNKGN